MRPARAQRFTDVWRSRRSHSRAWTRRCGCAVWTCGCSASPNLSRGGAWAWCSRAARTSRRRAPARKRPWRRYVRCAARTPARLLLAELPVGSRIIPNPYNRVAGFSVGHHHFLPGFPEMAWPMLCWVLDTQYPELRRSRPAMERVLRVRAREGELLELMQAFVARYPTCRFSSLPELGQEPWLELGVRGEEAVVEDGVRFWRTALRGRGIRWEERQPQQRGADDEGT